MANNSRSTIRILIAGTAVIALAVMLFVNAMNIGDFSQTGQDFFSGRSNARLAGAFVLLIGLALALLFMMIRTIRAVGDVPGAGEPRAREKAAKKRATVPEGAALSADAPEGKADASAGTMSEAAGELRTSDEVIREELEEIFDDEVPADKELLQLLYGEADRLTKIIDSMEQLSRAQAIALAPRQETLQIEPLLKGIIAQTRLAVTDRDVTYALECEAGLAMQGDPECVSRIIGNLADNAARSLQGSGSVTLTAGRAGMLMVFSVKDTGAGIRRAHLPHIYERFFRGTGSGIGMGLSIVKALVDARGGKIEVRTDAGKGTTFTVQLPAE